MRGRASRPHLKRDPLGSTAAKGLTLTTTGQAQDGDWLRLDELTNAIDNLEMCSHFLRSLPHPIRWKWAILALHQTIYGFAICAVKGTDDGSVLEQPKAAKEPRLISIWEAIRRANDPRFLWPGATPLQVTQEEKQALQKLLAEFRNGFEHFQPAGWSIELSGMPSLFRTAVGLVRRLAIDQGSVRYYSTEDRDRVSSAIAQLDGLVANGSAA